MTELTEKDRLALALNACKLAESALLKDCMFFCNMEGCGAEGCKSAIALKRIREAIITED